MSIKPEAIWAPQPSTIRGQPTPLSCDPKGERIVYANQKSIFLREIDTPAHATQYTGHTTTTTVARFAPSGHYVASGDIAGTVRVWGSSGEMTTKGEYHIIGGRINDLAWDGDSARIIACGEGKERFGHCFTADSGNSVGEISGHTAQINSVAIRGQRPLRAATAGDDASLVFYHGAPFKFVTSLRGQHTRFIYAVAFAPDGSTLASAGADGRICLYDGKTGDPRGPIGAADAHKGSIFGLSWAQDSRRFATAGADQTVRIWDVEAGKMVQSWRMGEEGSISVPEQQVGVVWPARTDGLILSLSLGGSLNYLVEGTPKAQKAVQGHQKGVTALGITNDERTLCSGSSDGRVCCWNVGAGTAEAVDGESHTNYVSAVSTSSDGRIYSVGWDDSLRTIDAAAGTFVGQASATDGQPKGVVALANKAVLVATQHGLELFVDGQSAMKSKTAFAPTCLAAYETLVAVGGDNYALHIYELDVKANSLKTVKSIADASSAISTLAFAPGGKLLAVGFASGKISVFDTAKWDVAISRWSAHSGRVLSIAWNASGTLAASGGLDTTVFVWSVAKPGRRISAANAHKDGVNGVVWLGAGRIASCGQDGAVKCWAVEGVE